MNKIYVLFLGKEDWSKKNKVPQQVEFCFCEHLRSLPEKEQKRIADIVILDRKIFQDEADRLKGITRGYCLFATEQVDMSDQETAYYFEGKMGQYLYTGDIALFLEQETPKYYDYSYGEKFSSNALAVSQFFHGKISCQGNYNLMLEGDFGEDFSQIAYWRYTIPIYEKQSIDLYLEYQKMGDVEIRLRAVQFYSGSADAVRRIWEFDETELSGVVTIGHEDAYGPVFMSILAKGKGSLTITSLHDRHSRDGRGYFIPGGERLVSSKGEEVFCYFEKADMKPPLAVYFSGYRSQEGFEGYYMMRKFGCPFLLLTDPRSEGGAFYVGDEEFESMISNVIWDKMRQLGFSEKDVVLSGASMGTYGSLYYGAEVTPHALILAKPLTNMGSVARNERILRTGGFGTSLDILMKNYGALEETAVEAFDQRMWKRFDTADWSKTKFIVSYLYEDDYDPDGYQNILLHLKSDGVEVFGKGNHGRHTDNSASVMEWFKSQYEKLLEEDYNRKVRRAG